ncbi:MAG: hypothetical protein KDK70_31140 [Myxococcales bacterium]|nr:hypothetical protein [Myxococcales bacterium]
MRIALALVVSTGALALGCGDDTSSNDDGPLPLPGTSGGSASDDGAITTSGVPGTDSGSDDGPADSSTGDDGSTSTDGGAVCGNGAIEDDEVCDGADVGTETCQTQGFDGGALACTADCAAYDTRGCTMAQCGDGLVEGAEACDGMDLAGATCQTQGFDSGALACAAGCQGFDTSDCGTCGNVIVDGDEACDDVALLGETCESQGFEYGQLACNATCDGFETGGCGLCGDGSVGGAEACDGVDLAGATCVSLGGGGGTLACSAACTFDMSGCDFAVQQYDVSAPNTSSTQNNYFRSHGYAADGDGLLMDFEVYLGLAGACDLDFYVYEAPAFGGPYTQVVRTTVTSGPGTGYYPAGLPAPVPITSGMYYVTGVGWNCAATYYWDNTGAYAGHDAGIGIFNVSHWDNAYPGASDVYVPPNTGGGGTAYVHRYLYAGM